MKKIKLLFSLLCFLGFTKLQAHDNCSILIGTVLITASMGLRGVLGTYIINKWYKNNYPAQGPVAADNLLNINRYERGWRHQARKISKCISIIFLVACIPQIIIYDIQCT